MDFPLTRAVAPLLEVAGTIGSTNDELVAREAAARQPHGTALITLDQTAGRGRLDRRWVAPAGSAVALSVVLRIPAGSPALGWVSMIGGLAARDAVARELLGLDVTVKWPNDVLVGVGGTERKVCGVRGELVATTSAVVLGIGINTTMSAADIPVPTATSIALMVTDRAADIDGLADRVASATLDGVLNRVARILDSGGDARGAGIAREADQHCSTLGRRVRVDLPGDGVLEGIADGLEPDASLRVRRRDGALTAVHAGDVTHLRYG